MFTLCEQIAPSGCASSVGGSCAYVSVVILSLIFFVLFASYFTLSCYLKVCFFFYSGKINTNKTVTIEMLTAIGRVIVVTLESNLGYLST